MIIELSNHDIDIKEIDIKNIITYTAKYHLDFVSVFPYYAKSVNKISNNLFKVSCPIDYPLGYSDLHTRQTEIIGAIKNGASKVDVVIPTLCLVNAKYDKFKEDIRCNLDICNNHNVQIFYMLEYRIFNHNTLIKIANILQEFGINTVYGSTGYMLDDITDNTIANMYLAKKTGINTIINGNMWNKNQIKSVVNHKPYGIRLKNIYALQLLNEKEDQKG